MRPELIHTSTGHRYFRWGPVHAGLNTYSWLFSIGVTFYDGPGFQAQVGPFWLSIESGSVW